MKKIFVVAALFISSRSVAQDTLENVTLTANKFSTKTTETGKVVVTISRAQIEKAGSRDLAQVITEMGGVFINGYTNNAGKDKSIFLRGGKVDYTLITIDGVPVYDASGIGSNFDIRYMPIDNVERIEILKGSQSSLYGSDAIAGVINIITRQAGTKPFSVHGVAHYGSYNTKRANAGVNGAIKKLDYSISLSHYHTNGFSEAQQPHNSTAGFDKDKYRQNNVQANFSVQATSRFRIQPYLRYSKSKGGLDNDAFVDELDFNYEAKNLQAGVKNVIGAGKGQVNILYQFNNTERSYLDDSTLSRNGFYFYNQAAYKAAEHFAEAFIVYPFNKFKLTAGADFRSSGTDLNSLQISGFGTDKTQQSGDSINQQQVSIYTALHYSSNQFTMEGGTRINHHSQYGNNAAFNINPSYFIQKQLKVFINASSGYKTPSLYQLFSIYGNKALKPETSLNLEAGAQVFSKDGKANLRATYFNRRVKDVIAYFFNPVSFQSNYINQDVQKDHGVELDGTLNLSDKIQVKLFYAHVDGKVTTIQSGKDTTYFNLLRRPKNTLSFSIGSQLAKSIYSSLQFHSVGTSHDVYFNPVTFAAEPIILKNYLLVNFYTEYAFANNRLKLFADLRNVFDESYSDIYGYNTPGFNGYGGIRFRF